VQADALDGVCYENDALIKSVRYKWKTRASVSETIGQYVKETDNEEIKMTGSLYGKQIDVDLCTRSRFAIQWRFDQYINRFNLTKTVFPLPLTDTLVLPGMVLVWTDNRYTQSIDSSGSIKGIVYDFMDKKLTLEAFGSSP
jgi:hypothetical protein